MAAQVRSTWTIAVGSVARLFMPASEWRDYDVGPDSGFLAIIPLRLPAAQPLTVVSAWPRPRP